MTGLAGEKTPMADPDTRRGPRLLPQELPRSRDALTLPARPEAFPISPQETALIVVDMQNGYASPGGYIDIQGFDISGAKLVTERIVRVIATAREIGSTVVFLQNGWERARHEAGTPDSPNWWKSNALKLMRAEPTLDGTLITRGTWDYELVAELRPEPRDIVLNKTRYSGFWGTPLDAILRARRIRTLLFVGIATNVCVESTLRDAYFLEYFPILIEDAALHAGPLEMQAATVYNVEKFFGWVTTTSEVCALTNR
jgi:ureidoacrylate peracid hydrolase